MSRTLRTMVFIAGRSLVAAGRVALSLCRSLFSDTPRRLLVLLLAAAVVGFLLVGAWSRIWSRLPWAAEQRLDRAEAELAVARSALRARRIEAHARAGQAAALDAAHDVLTQARAATASAASRSQGAPDADQPLDPDRLARLRAHDRRLCELSPALCPDAAEGRSSGPVAPALPSAAPAG